MDIIQACVLALLQGLTEFLPISSSAHLILVPVVFDWEDQGLAFDVAVHVGTLSAVVTYYRSDLMAMGSSWFRSLAGKPANDDSRLVWWVVLGTIPVGLVGITLPDRVETFLRSPVIIGSSTIIFALLIAVAEKTAKEKRSQILLIDALVIGVFQAIALIPGTSRSGITITAGLLTGLERNQAARFSFLLSIPVIALAGMLKTYQLIQSTGEVAWDLMAAGVCVSAVIAYLTIGWFLTMLEKIGLMPFVYYRLILGIVLLVVFI